MSSKKFEQSSRQPSFHMSSVMWLFRRDPVSCGGQGAVKISQGSRIDLAWKGVLSARFSCDHFRPEPVVRVQKNANFTAEPGRSPPLMEIALMVCARLSQMWLGDKYVGKISVRRSLLTCSVKFWNFQLFYQFARWCDNSIFRVRYNTNEPI